jgi:hypothetical protein
MKGSIVIRRAAPLLVLAFATGCPPRRPPPDLSLEPRELLAQVSQAQAVIRSVQGEARVAVDGPGGSGTVRQFLAAEAPDRLHVEALDFFGNPVAVLAAGGGRFSLYDAREKVLWRGAATPENLARLVPLPIAAEDLVRILCGYAPLLPGEPARVDQGRGFAELVLEAGSRTQTLRVGPNARVLRSTVREGGAQPPGAYDLVFGDPDDAARPGFPSTVTLRASEPRVKLDLRWSEVEVNAAVDPKLFRMDPPRGARVVELEQHAPGPPSLFQPTPSASSGPAPTEAPARPRE